LKEDECVSVGNYVLKSKHQSVKKAVEWSVGLVKAALDFDDEFKQVFLKSGGNQQSFTVLAKNLEVEFKGEIKPHRRLVQHIRDLRNQENDNYTSGNLKNAVNKALTKTGLPKLPWYVLLNGNHVTPSQFTGKSTRWKQHKDVIFQNKPKVTSAKQKL
jgi:hypothetical protein